jgi:hypothetical protein
MVSFVSQLNLLLWACGNPVYHGVAHGGGRSLLTYWEQGSKERGGTRILISPSRAYS